MFAGEYQIRYAARRHHSRYTNELRRLALPDYRVLTNEGSDLRVIKIGFSWPALFLNLIWLVANGLWLGAILIFVMVAGMLILFGSAVQESPVAASVMSFSAGCALLLFLGFRGNDWLASQFESRGYTQVRTLEAASFMRALELSAADHHGA